MLLLCIIRSVVYTYLKNFQDISGLHVHCIEVGNLAVESDLFFNVPNLRYKECINKVQIALPIILFNVLLKEVTICYALKKILLNP